MTGWTALVPLKLGPEAKSRLAPVLTPEARQRLASRMAGHVIAQLGAVEAIREIVVIAREAVPHWPVRHVLDRTRGLNRELDAVAAAVRNRVHVIHGDLPLVSSDDIAALLDAAERVGAAIAPDRHGQGTNALALRSMPEGFRFAFGDASFAAHQAGLGKQAVVIVRDGLGCDVDTPDDLDLAVARGWIETGNRVLP